MYMYTFLNGDLSIDIFKYNYYNNSIIIMLILRNQ